MKRTDKILPEFPEPFTNYLREMYGSLDLNSTAKFVGAWQILFYNAYQ